MNKRLATLLFGSSTLAVSGLLGARFYETQNTQPVAVANKTENYLVPGGGTELDLDSFPITTPRTAQSLVDNLADSGVSDRTERLNRVRDTHLVYEGQATKNTPDIRFSTTTYTSPVLQIFDNITFGPFKRYGKTLETIGNTKLYILNKPFEQASITDIQEAERKHAGLDAIPMDYGAKQATEFELSKFNKLWKAYANADAEEGQVEALQEMRGLENIFNNAPVGTVIGVATQDKTRGESYYILKITSEKPLGKATRDAYLPNWFTDISVRRLYDNKNSN